MDGVRERGKSDLLGVDEQIFRLDVSMYDVLAVAVLNSLEQLVNVVADLIELDSIWVLLKNLKQVFVKILEDQVETVAPVENQNFIVKINCSVIKNFEPFS